MSRASQSAADRPVEVDTVPRLKSGAFVPEPPPGWELPNATHMQRASSRLAGWSVIAVSSLQRTITRRDFVKRVGAGAAAASLGLGSILFRPEKALAYDPCGPNLPYGCGPSEICSDDKCNTSGNCKTATGTIERRAKPDNTWPGNYCASNTASNFWYECCNHDEKLCADCCVGACGSCDSCSGCTSKKKCICRSTTGSC